MTSVAELVAALSCAVLIAPWPGLAVPGSSAADGFERARVGYWRFDDATWEGENGQRPLLSTNIQHAPSFDGLALQVTNNGGLLRYSGVGTNGLPLIDCRHGSIRFWFKPNWSSTSVGGAGPGHNARFLAMGQFKAPGWNTNANDGCFILGLDPPGTAIGLALQDNHGRTQGPGSLPVTFVSNRWHEIMVTFDARNVRFWFNGVLSQWQELDGLPCPPASVQAQGFCVGNAFQGGLPILGQIDELELFNYPLEFVGAAATGQILSATAASSPPGIELRWRARPDPTLAIQRRLPAERNWTTLVTNLYAWTYSDTNVVPGQDYEYKVLPTGLQSPKNALSIRAGLNLPPVENRGKVILLVDNTLAGALVTELDQLKEDLVGDGWSVIRHEVPRHDDGVWSNNPANIARIKARIVSDYTADPATTKALLILGHVAVPYTGAYAEDGHSQHFGAWPCDLYYGDVDGIWTDNLNAGSAQSYAETVNRRGDGKWDQDRIPRNKAGVAQLELSVGRVDFARMPAFTAAKLPRSEAALLGAYLNKDHAYRHKRLVFAPRVVEHSFFPHAPGRYPFMDNVVFASGAARHGSRWFGAGPERTIDSDVFGETGSYLWGFLYGYGGPDRIGIDSATPHTSQDLTAAGAPVAFCVLYGSYFGDWNLGVNNFMRATLCSPNSGLAAIWGGFPVESMALGASLGDAQLLAANTSGAEGISRTAGIMGDQTLGLNVVAPAANLSSASNGPIVTLTWTASFEPDARYLVYRSTNGLDGPFSRLTAIPIRTTNFVETNAPSGKKLYQVRSLKLQLTGSGSYTNLSQGIFKAVN